jgi:hypothetical protein
MNDVLPSGSTLISNPEKPCKCCAGMIPKAARYCTHCENHQGWFRRNLAVGETTLALLVAFVAVLAAAVPPVVAWFHTPGSKVHQISTIFVEGGLKVVMVNEGDRSGVFQIARMVFEQNDNAPSVLVNFEVSDPTLLAPNAARAYQLKPSPPLTRDGDAQDIVLAIQAVDFADEIEAAGAGRSPTPVMCDLVFETISFAGAQEKERLQNRCVTAWLALFPDDRALFREHQQGLEAGATVPAAPPN